MQPVAVAESYLRALNAGDVEAVVALVSDDFVNEHTAALGEGSVGRDEYAGRLPGFLGAFDGLHYALERVVADGPTVAVAYRLTATSDGHPIDVRGVMLIDVADGAITRRVDYWDSLTYLRQTGAAGR